MCAVKTKNTDMQSAALKSKFHSLPNCKGVLLIALIDRINNLLFNLNRMSCRSTGCMWKKGLLDSERKRDGGETHLVMTVVLAVMVLMLSKNRPIWNFEYFVNIPMRITCSWRHKRASNFRLDFKCSMLTPYTRERIWYRYRYYTRTYKYMSISITVSEWAHIDEETSTASLSLSPTLLLHIVHLVLLSIQLLINSYLYHNWTTKNNPFFIR